MSVTLNLVKGIAVAASGFAAGTINAIVGSGTLISFPALLGVGFDPVPANIANNIGLTPASFSAASAQRVELTGQASRVRRLALFSIVGSALGAVLLLKLPPGVFKRVVPFLVLVGVVLVILQPQLQARLRAQREASPSPTAVDGEAHSWALRFGVFATGVYGGYFGAGQGVILMGILGATLDDKLPRLNATKNMLAGCANATAGLFFVIRGIFFGASIPWAVAGIIAVFSTVGGQLGARLARRIPPNALRALIVVVGTTVALKLLLSK